MYLERLKQKLSKIKNKQMTQLLEAPDMKQLKPGSQAERDAYEAFKARRREADAERHSDVTSGLAEAAVSGVVSPAVEREVRAQHRVEVVDQTPQQQVVEVSQK